VTARQRADSERRLDRDAAAEAAQLSGAIYGTVLAAAVLVASTEWDDPGALDTGVYVLGTMVAFWLAHAWAHMLARQAVGAVGAERGWTHALRHDWPLVQSCLPPLVAIAVASLLGASGETAIDVAIWVCIAVLAAWGGAIAHREGASWMRVIRAAVGAGGLGLLIVLVQALVH
jgi:hypothetical protein